MNITLMIELAALFALLGLSAFFSSSETSLFSLSSAQMQQMRRDRNPRLALIEQLLSEPRRLIATILIGNEFVNVSASVLSATIIIDLFGTSSSWLNVVIMVPMLLLFGEITPKTLAYSNNVAFATFQSRYIDLFARTITPLRKAVRVVSEFFINLIVSGERSHSNILTEDMVRSLTNAAVGEGSLDSKESQYIHQIFDFGNKTLRDLMTYRSQIISIKVSMPLAEILDLVKGNRHSKLPVFSEDGESVVGVLFARDILGMKVSANPATARKALKAILREPYLVPATRMATDLFRKMRERRTTLALVTDEFGGIIGMITLEDFLQSIFGDLPSWSDSKLAGYPSIEVLGNDLYRTSGSLSLRQFNAVAGTAIEQAGVSTIGGLVLHACGEVPAKNAVVPIGDVTFTVDEATQQRVLALTAQVGRKTRRKHEQESDDTPDTEAGES
jgi:putative hemolysin